MGHVQGRGAGSGVPIDGTVVMLWAFEGTRAVHAKFFASKEEALEAVGLSE